MTINMTLQTHIFIKADITLLLSHIAHVSYFFIGHKSGHYFVAFII